MSPGSRWISRLPTRAPMARPTSWAGSAAAATHPRWATSRPNFCWYRMEATDANPSREAARKGRA